MAVRINSQPNRFHVDIHVDIKKGGPFRPA